MGKQKPEDRAMTIAGEGAANCKLMQQFMPKEMQLQEGESHDAYLDRIAAPFMEWLVSEAMMKGNQTAMMSLTKLFEKKIDAQVKIEMLTGRGKVRQAISGSPGAIGRMMGASKLDDVMAGRMRPSDIGGKA